MSKKFYITTTLPYANAKPHVGFALEVVQADCIARYKVSAGFDVRYNTGTDEHGQKMQQNARDEGIGEQEYVDKQSKYFEELITKLNIASDKGIEYSFIRTTDKNHEKAAQEFWKLCEKDIYKKEYKIKYCVGCELEKTDSELKNGKCILHPNAEIQIIEEENYFFAFSRYKDDLLKLYSNIDFVLPEAKLNEIRAFIERGPQDFSISRLKEKMSWGVGVPGDEEHVMYVWFDALVNYISTLGWPNDEYTDWWPGVQIAGKDNIRQQAAMWQAMLLSAGIKPSEKILIHGFINSGGKKMSKSVGNVVDPIGIIEKFGTDALRYYLLRELPTFEDGDFTEEHFVEMYNANLANGLGNLVSRIMQMSETHLDEPVEIEDGDVQSDWEELMNAYELKKAADILWKHISNLDQKIQETEPFKLVKVDKEAGVKIITELVQELNVINKMLKPFMPETNEKIDRAIKENKKPMESLFSRIEQRN